MLPILQRRFRALENSKTAILDQLRTVPQDRLDERPSTDRWSAAELISHLARVEAGMLQSVKQKLAEEDEARIKLRDRVGSLIVRNVMRSPLRVKVPAEPVTTQPEQHARAEDALAEWERTRQDWQEFLTHIRGPQLKSAVFSHPKGGWFTLPETVLFLRLHHDHHRAQFARLAKTLTSTPGTVPA